MYSRVFFSDEAACFSFISERSCTYICREGNGGGFSVVEGLARRADDEILEMDEALLPELYNLDQARIKQRGQLDSVLTTFWTRIGSAWPHQHGEGFSIELNALPVQGRIVLKPPKADDSTGAEVAR